jgi:hypothetical protein
VNRHQDDVTRLSKNATKTVAEMLLPFAEALGGLNQIR